MLIRSTAAGGRLGGLAAPTREAAEALAPAFDVVVVETVGVGQSETDVEEVCDTVAVVVQPGSGDVLQFLKAGIMEVPDVLVVTKADLGAPADRARRDLEQAVGAVGAGRVPVLAVSCIPPTAGVQELVDALDAHGQGLDPAARRPRARRLSAVRELTAEHGERALRALGGAPGGGAAPGGPGPEGRHRRAGGGAGGGDRVLMLARQIALLIAVVAVTTLVAELAGAANLGVSLGMAQVAFAIVLVAILSRG